MKTILLLLLFQTYIVKHVMKNINSRYLLYEWCEICQINYLKDNFANWTRGNGKLLDCLIQDLIQEMQSEINSFYDAIFE